MKHIIYFIFIVRIFLAINFAQIKDSTGSWIKADFHIHTTMSDGDITPSVIAQNAFEKYNLDLISITDHGGHFFKVNSEFQRIDTSGNVFTIKNYDSLMSTESSKFKDYSRSIQLQESSFPEILRLREKYNSKLIIQGFEFNVPGHDHACVGIISENCEPLSNFQFVYDRNDTLKSFNNLFSKHNANFHTNALSALKFLQDNFNGNSYFIINHPSRKLQYKIEEIRDFIDTAPNVVVGFEGLPGHQINFNNRCKYNLNIGDQVLYHSKTYGGADYMLAKVGGLWDALLGEGRNFWIFANSDFHRPKEDSWPGEYAKNYLWINEKKETLICESLQKGKLFAVTGDLITDLDFSIEFENTKTEMGQNINLSPNSEIKIKIAFKDGYTNSNNDKMSVDHIDLICGDIENLLKQVDKKYNDPTNITTKILKRFNKNEFTKSENGFYYVTFNYNISKSQYFRLRGTNLPINFKNETDSDGNPLCDSLIGSNDEKHAWKDLWIYSNPIFVTIK
jgi:hypothetical protein